MAKIKRQEFESTDDEFTDDQDSLSSADKDDERPQLKRTKTMAPFNFSIESLMQSAACEPTSRRESPQHDDDTRDSDQSVSRLAKPAVAPSTSTSSSTSTSTSTGVAPTNQSNHNQQQQHQQQQQQQQQQQSASSTNTASHTSGGRISQVGCVLDNQDMWDKFHSLNTEMIITKTGRRMFPVMKVQFHNLDPNARYMVTMDIVPVDNKRYRYAYHKSCWQVAGKADPSAEPRIYAHPDSPFNGDLLSRQVISFEKVKLTNNEMDKSNHIILNSMHKYQPRVHLIELNVPASASNSASANSKSIDSHLSTTSNSNLYNSQHQSHYANNNNNNNNNNTHNRSNTNNHHQQQPELDIKGYRTFVFPETVFTAVTAYQNQLITKMKIDKNPFAKGFRDSSRLSDLDRNDPFDYMSSLGPAGRFVGAPGQPGGLHGSLEAAAAAAGAHMDAYQLLAATANNPWYSAAMAAAAAGGGAAPNPFNPMAQAPGACNSVAHLQATQMWLAAFSACLNGGAGGPNGSTGPGPGPSGMSCDNPGTPPNQ